MVIITDKRNIRGLCEQKPRITCERSGVYIGSLKSNIENENKKERKINRRNVSVYLLLRV